MFFLFIYKHLMYLFYHECPYNNVNDFYIKKMYSQVQAFCNFAHIDTTTDKNNSVWFTQHNSKCSIQWVLLYSFMSLISHPYFESK